MLVHPVAVPNPSVAWPLAHDSRGQPPGLPGRPSRRRAGQGDGGDVGARVRVRAVGDDVVHGVGLLKQLCLEGDELDGADGFGIGSKGVGEMAAGVDSVRIGRGEGGLGGSKLPECPEAVQFNTPEPPPGVPAIGKLLSTIHINES